MAEKRAVKQGVLLAATNSTHSETIPLSHSATMPL